MAHALKEDYILNLKGLVSWSMKEAFDEKLDTILRNIKHNSRKH